MNGVAQREHRKVTTELRQDIADVAASFALEVEVLREALAKEREERARLIAEAFGEQRAYIDESREALRQCCQSRWDKACEADRSLRSLVSGFTSQGFWSRLNWLLFGR